MSSRIVTVITQIMVMAVVISIVLLFVGIGVLVLIHLCIVGRAFRRSFGDRRSHGNGMSPADVQKLPCFEYKLGIQAGSENGSVVGDSECAVCLEGFQRGEKCRMLPVCRHCFHANCVDAWLCKTPVCPICRTGVEQNGGKLESDDGSYGAPVSRVITCELNVLPGDFAIGIPVQGGVSNYRNSEMGNAIPNASASPDDARAISVSQCDQNRSQHQNLNTGF